MLFVILGMGSVGDKGLVVVYGKSNSFVCIGSGVDVREEC